MGTFRVTIATGDPSGDQYTPVEALVDTGATYTTLPSSLFRRLGVIPHDRAEFQFADGNVVERDIGRTWVRLDERTEIVPVVFAEEGALALLGAVTLEVFRLGVDSVGQRLMPVRGLLMMLANVRCHFHHLIRDRQRMPVGTNWSHIDSAHCHNVPS